MSKVDLWVEKYRPDTLEGYVFKDQNMKEQVEYWIKNPENKKIPFPNLLLSGKPGTGKTTLAKMLCNEVGVNEGDILFKNASRDNNVNTVRDTIVDFCSTWPIGDYKVIILDEFDGFSQAAQHILRAEMETHADTVRFILTCNYPHKIIEPIHSRSQGFHLDGLDMEGFITRILGILTSEEIDFDDQYLDAFIDASYPDLRRCINLLSLHCRNGKLHPLTEGTGTSLDYMEKAIELFKNRKYTDARKLITSRAELSDYEEIYRFLYNNVHLFGENEKSQEAAIIIIAKGLRNHSLVADAEINLAATLVELSMCDA